MRLNGWQRIGIVASVIWAIGAPIYLDHAAEQKASEWFMSSYELCRNNPSNDGNTCLELASRQYDLVERYRLLSANGAVAALVPVGLGWLLVYALVYLVRRIRAGFKP